MTLQIIDDFLEQWYVLDLDELSVNIVYPFSIIIHAILLVKTNGVSSETVYKEVWGNWLILIMNLHFTLKVLLLFTSCINMYAVLNQYKKYNILHPMNTVVDSKISTSNAEFVLSVWEPKQLLLQFMICINPLHMIIHISDINWYYKLVFISISWFLSSLLVNWYNQLIKDKQTLYELVMQEYNVKKVFPMQQLLNEEEYSLLDSPNQKRHL